MEKDGFIYIHTIYGKAHKTEQIDKTPVGAAFEFVDEDTSKVVTLRWNEVVHINNKPKRK